MKILPEHTAVGKPFDDHRIFYVPKYQRGYAWGESEISDFLDDFQKSFDARAEDPENPIRHFFGGIVSIEKDVEGAAHKKKYEIIDGQQRIATFVILISRVIKIYKELLEEVEQDDEDTIALIKSRIQSLTSDYIESEVEINREFKTFKRLELSGADQAVFRDLLNDREIDIERDSHKKLKNAFKEIEKRVQKLIDKEESISDKLSVLETIKELVDSDFSFIKIITYNQQDAYRLFQVLNDRGVSLTEGDLLRAKTLELLDPDEFASKQDTVEKAWDDILKDEPSDTEKFLRWIYASYEGKRPGKSSLFEDFLDKFFPVHNVDELTEGQAESIVNTVKKLQKEFRLIRMLKNGDWPFDIGEDVSEWEVDRLNLLMSELKHDTCLPLLLSACQLSINQFKEIINLTERIYFRYKLVCGEHEGSLKNMYQRESVKVREDPENYNIDSYKNEIIDLQDRKADEEKFSNLLEDFVYQTSGGNKKIRYFFLTLEYSWRWFQHGANGNPDFNSDIVHSFSTTSVVEGQQYSPVRVTSIPHLFSEMSALN